MLTNQPRTTAATGRGALDRVRAGLKGRILIGFGAMIAAIAFLATSTALSLPGRTIATASADPCPNVQVVFARGTGEPAGAGKVGQAFVDSLRPLVGGKSVAVYAVDYPASYDFIRATDGAKDASAFVQNIAATCPDTRIVLGGFSQGAAVVDLITMGAGQAFGFANPMPADVARHVAAVAVFGNPSNRIGGGPLTAISPLFGDKAIDLCNGADPVCSPGNDRAAHSLYVESGMTSQAAQFVAQRVAAPAHTVQDTAGSSSAANPPAGQQDAGPQDAGPQGATAAEQN